MVNAIREAGAYLVIFFAAGENQAVFFESYPQGDFAYADYKYIKERLADFEPLLTN